MFILEMLATIPEIVRSSTDKSHKVWYIKPYLYIVITLKALYEATPYRRSLYRMSFDKYTETIMYRERLINFGEDFAQKMFIEHLESRFFMSKITRREKLKALFMPFSYIRSL